MTSKDEHQDAADLPGPAQVAAAVDWNNSRWTGPHRDEILAFLRGAAGSAGADFFGPADVQRVAGIQAGAGADVDGLLGPCTMAVLLHSGFRFSRPPAPAAGAVTIEFFPGELEDLDAWRQEIERVVAAGGTYRDVNSPPAGAGRLYALANGQVVGAYTARGGPPFPVKDLGGHVATPTDAGTYRLGPGHAIVAPSWPFSQIPWGAAIQQVGDDFQYLVPGSHKWSFATGPHSSLGRPLSLDDFTDLDVSDAAGQRTLRWNKNDFGPMGWNLLGTAFFVHTTPDTEAAAQRGQPVLLPPSHGCIHVIPAERDEMVARGYLQQHVRFVVKDYREHLLPEKLRATLRGQ